MTSNRSGGEVGRPKVVLGAAWTVEYAVDAKGNSPARDFVEALPPDELAKIARLFQWLADLALGDRVNPEKFKQLEGKIHELKSYQIRIPCFRDGRCWVLTHGFRKKKDSVPRAEIDRAHRIRDEDLSRRPPSR